MPPQVRRSASRAACLCALALAPLTAKSAQDPNETRSPGVSFRLYQIGHSMGRLMDLVPGQTPNVSKIIPRINLDEEHGDFAPAQDNFLVEITGYINVDRGGEWHFELTSDDGSRLEINNKLVIDHDGPHPPTAKAGSVTLKPGAHPFRIRMFEDGGGSCLALRYKPPWAGAGGAFVNLPDTMLTCPAGEVRVTSPGVKRVIRPLTRGRPGDLMPLDSVHPSFDLLTIRPPDFHPRVGGMDFLRDGRLVICTWDPDGAVYILDGVQGDDPAAIKISRFAAGLAEPLGLKVVNDQIYVLQKQELTLLLDNDRDGVADEYRTVCGNWPVTANFHEFAFGLIHKDNHFYCNLAVAINPGGRTTVPQLVGRGTVLKIAPDGSFDYVAAGLRTPNGIGLGVDGEIFVTDNQGDWLPSSKLLHVRPGRFFNAHLSPPGPFDDVPPSPPVLWLPHGEIGNSPGNPVLVPDGPFKGQMMHGDVTHGGVKRDFIEKIDGEYQGCVFRFTQGLEAGVNRICWGPDGALYVGGIGSTGNWGQEGKQRFGLQRLKPNGKPTFEMLAVRAMTNGLEIEFTEPLAASFDRAWDPDSYFVSQWRYQPTSDYGGEKVDERELPVKSATLSADRRRVFLELPGVEAAHVVYLRLLGRFEAESQRPLWSTETWYTMNRIPGNRPGQVKPAPHPLVANTLSDPEKAAGWRLLFDGKSTAGWHGFNRRDFPAGWEVQDGCLVHVDGGGDIVTDEEFENYELTLEWKISPGGNSGIFYNVQESEKYKYVWETGPEMQVLDNELHPDGRNPLTSAGSNYALHAPPCDSTLPVGRFNRVRIVVAADGHVEHWLNDLKCADYRLGDPDWTALVNASKFKSMPDYGRFRKGRIALQDHGDKVWYRNIKLRPLPASR